MMFMNMLAAAMAWALPLYGCLSNLALEVRIYSKVGACSVEVLRTKSSAIGNMKLDN